jgi:hypothetical protein
MRYVIIATIMRYKMNVTTIPITHPTGPTVNCRLFLRIDSRSLQFRETVKSANMYL